MYQLEADTVCLPREARLIQQFVRFGNIEAIR